jgi:hypothetical protein
MRKVTGNGFLARSHGQRHRLDKEPDDLLFAQELLALILLFAGGTKLVLPIEALTERVPLPCLFVRSVGVAELLGAIYLILPGLLRIRLRMAQLAAAGLMGIMIGSMVITLASR